MLENLFQWMLRFAFRYSLRFSVHQVLVLFQKDREPTLLLKIHRVGLSLKAQRLRIYNSIRCWQILIWKNCESLSETCSMKYEIIYLI